MKTIKTLKFLGLAIVVLSCSCNKSDDQSSENLNLEGMNISLNEDFKIGRAVYSLPDDLKKLPSELVEYIYHQEDGTMEVLEFRFDESARQLLLNYSEKLKNKVSGEPCPPEKDTCWSEKCVVETLQMIIGDGNRDVNIEYRYNGLSVTITWTYLDC